MKSEPTERLVTKMIIYYQRLTIASCFVCSVPLTIILTLFQELLKKRLMVIILSVFLTLSSYRLDNL